MKISLEEATMKALLGELEDDEPKDDVEGIIDGVLIVTDPEITPEEYEEVIERADELIEDTPEGEVPFNEDYVGEYLLTCPICGSTFINKTVLNVGDSCPICTQIPEQGFILNGQVATQEDVELQNDIKSEEEKEDNDDVNIGLDNDESPEEEPVSEEDVEEVQDELLASETIRESDKKLEEDKEIILTQDIETEKEAQDIVNSKSVFKKGDKVKVKDWNGREYNVTKTTTGFSDNEKEVESKETYMKRPEQLNENKEMKVESDNIIKEIKDKLYWLSTHNKNYNKEQYHTILDIQDLVDKLDDNYTDRKLTEINECTDLSVKTESNKYIPAEEKLEAIYDDYKRQGMLDAYWTDLLNLIDDFDALDRWFDASYPEDGDEDWDNLEED